MSFDVNWDIDKYKEEHESDEHWLLRRNFMEKWKHSYPEKRLVCLARVFANIEFMGCRYPTEVMQEVARMSKEVNKNLTYNNDFGVNLPYSSSGRHSQTPSTGSTWDRYSRNSFQGATTYSVDYKKDIEPIVDIGETSHAMDSHDALCRNPVGSWKSDNTMKTGSIDGIITNPDDGSKYVWDQFDNKVMQNPVRISQVLRNNFSKAFVPEKNLHQKLASNDNSTWCRYPNKDLQGASLLPELINPTSSQSSVQDNLQDSNIAGVSPLWRRRDPQVRQTPALTLAANPNSNDGNNEKIQTNVPEGNKTKKSKQARMRYQWWIQVAQKTEKEAEVLCLKPLNEVPEFEQIKEHKISLKYFIKNRMNEDFEIENNSPMPLSENRSQVFQGRSFEPQSENSFLKPISENKSPAFQDRSLEPQSENSSLMPTSENGSQVFQDRALMPVSESSSLITISENGPVPQESTICTNQGVDTSKDNHTNVPLKVDVSNLFRGPIVVNKKINMYTALPNNLTLSMELKCRYNFWRYVGKTDDEALVLCKKPMNEIPEYGQIKEQTGTFKQFLKNKSIRNTNNSNNVPFFCETPLAWTYFNILPPVKLDPSYPWKLKGSAKKRYDYWIQMDKSAEKAMVLSQRPYRVNQQKILKDKKIKSKRWKKLNRNMNEYKNIIMKKFETRRDFNINTSTTQPANINTTNKTIDGSKTPQENSKINMDKSKLNEKQITQLNWWMQQGKSEEDAYILCQKPMAISDAYAIVLERKDTIGSKQVCESQNNYYSTISINQETISKNLEPCDNSIEIENASKLRFWENAGQQILKDTTKNICPSTLTHKEILRPQMPLLCENSAETEKANELRFYDNVAEIQNSSHPKAFKDATENIFPSILAHKKAIRPQIKKRLPREISTETEKASKLMFKNIGTQNDSQLKVCIKDANKAICQKDYVALRDAISHCIGDDEEIKISRWVRKWGCVIMICADERSRDWVDKQIPTLEPWEGAQLIIIDEDKIPTLFYARVYIPTVPKSGPLVGLEPDDLMTKLHQQNPNVGCHKWKVLNTQVQKEGLLLIVRFDSNSKDVLQSQGLILNWYSSPRPLRVKLMKKKNQKKKLVVDLPYQENVSEGGSSNMSQVDDRPDRNPYIEMAAGMVNADACISRESRWDYKSATLAANNEKIHVSPNPDDTKQRGLRYKNNHVYETDTERKKDYYHHTGDKAGSVWGTKSHWLERRQDTDQATGYFHQEDISVRSPDYVHQTDMRAGSEWGFDTSQLLPEDRAAIGLATQNTHRKDLPEQAPDYTFQTDERAGSEWGLDTPHLLPDHRAAIVQATHNTHQENIALWAPDYTHQADDSRGPKRASSTSDRGRSEWGVNTPQLLPEHHSAIGHATEYAYQEDISIRAPDHSHRKNYATDSSRSEGVKRAIPNSLREDKGFKNLRQADYNHERTEQTEKLRTEYKVDSRLQTERNRTEYRDTRRSESSHSHTRRSGGTECYRTEYRDKRRPRRANSPRSHPRASEGHGLKRRY